MRRARKAAQAGKASPALTSIGFLLLRAQARLRAAVLAAIEGSGLQPGHLAVLGALSDCGGMSQKRLGELTQIEKSSVVIFLDALETTGWVRRERDPEDRRAHIVQLTQEGARKLAALEPRLLAAQQQFLEPLTGGNVATLTRLLKRLSAPLG